MWIPFWFATLALFKLSFGQEEIEYSLGTVEQLVIDQGLQSFHISIVDSITQHDHLEISTELDSPLNLTEAIEFALIYGEEPMTWSLDNQTRSSTSLICLNENSDGSSLIVTSRTGISEATINLVIQRKNISLTIDSSITKEVSLGNALTYLIDPNEKNSLSGHQGLVINVENTEPPQENVCIVMAVQDQSCPLNNKPESVQRSVTWLTVMETATLTLRYDREPFNEAFYVSLVMLEDDSACYLSGEI